MSPAACNNWHIHHASKGGGQILLCVAGRGWYQEWGQEARELHPGDVVNIPPEVKHWHGAAADSWFSHLALEVPGEDCANEWLEPSPTRNMKSWAEALLQIGPWSIQSTGVVLELGRRCEQRKLPLVRARGKEYNQSCIRRP